MRKPPVRLDCWRKAHNLILARRPDGRRHFRFAKVLEESPGSTGIRGRVTPGGGDPRESATESKPPVRTPRLRGGGG